MEVKIKWSPRAAAHLTDICDYIAEDSKVYARIFSQKVLALIKEISQFPQSGRVVPEYQDKNLRERIYGSYRIVYRVKKEVLEVVAICHGARLLKNV